MIFSIIVGRMEASLGSILRSFIVMDFLIKVGGPVKRYIKSVADKVFRVVFRKDLTGGR